MAAPRIALLDYGMGNLRSIEKAIERVGAQADRTYHPERVRAADGLVLPGVGAFPKAMSEVRARGFDRLLSERLAAGVPVLGICLGMQLLFERSSELGGGEGLGVLAGEVRPLEAGGLKVPQIGWNAVGWRRPSAITAQLPQPCAFYHVHSFAPAPADPEAIVGIATYGAEFVSVVARENVFGVQFHPEKSGPDGLALLAGFARVCGRAAAGARGDGRLGAVAPAA
ncbi:MAG: imidazole glycerol phosphate synthase subunit HisH [Thermoleophilaceae bacterium]|jgi:glutamine amidotransferase|nr:imidazole glycerol phosphate synthase subunit HisH [Thermoleophilaceae bacterium]